MERAVTARAEELSAHWQGSYSSALKPQILTTPLPHGCFYNLEVLPVGVLLIHNSPITGVLKMPKYRKPLHSSSSVRVHRMFQHAGSQNLLQTCAPPGYFACRLNEAVEKIRLFWFLYDRRLPEQHGKETLCQILIGPSHFLRARKGLKKLGGQ